MSSSDFLPAIGGVAAVVWELSRALAARGHEVHVTHWSQKKSFEPAEEIRDGVTLHRLETGTRWRCFQRPVGTFRVARSLRALFAHRRLDVIHSHTFHPDAFAARWFPRCAGKFFTNHTSGFLDGFKSTLRRREYRWILRGFDCVLAPSLELRDLSRQCGAPNVTFIPNGVDPERFCPNPLAKAGYRRKLDIPEKARVVLVARRFEVKNGIRYMAAAFHRIHEVVPESLLVFCGGDYDGLELPAVHKALRETGMSRFARFEGVVPNQDMPRYYAIADVTVLPSLQEATSVTGLEAMASALPVVGTTVGGIPTLIEHGRSGLLVAPGNSEALAAAVIRTLQDPALAESLGAAARHRVCESFSWGSVAAETEQAYVSNCAAQHSLSD
jgi:glycosyltransferase involved in cell wall biosynthesis